MPIIWRAAMLPPTTATRLISIFLPLLLVDKSLLHGIVQRYSRLYSLDLPLLLLVVIIFVIYFQELLFDDDVLYVVCTSSVRMKSIFVRKDRKDWFQHQNNAFRKPRSFVRAKSDYGLFQKQIGC
jgi:hypothetical protein